MQRQMRKRKRTEKAERDSVSCSAIGHVDFWLCATRCHFSHVVFNVLMVLMMLMMMITVLLMVNVFITFVAPG